MGHQYGMKGNSMNTYYVKYAGICGSDINKIKSKDFDPNKILQFGHEIVCESQDGALYVVNPFVCNPDCKICDSTSLLYCKQVHRLGDGTVDSGFSGKITILPENLFKIPSCKYPQVGVLCDGIAVIFHGLHMININMFSKIAIIGSGSIGVLAALLFKEQNHNCSIEIYVRTNEKQEYLNSHYSDYFNIIDINAINCVNEKYDLVVEAVGGLQTDSISIAIDIVKKNGAILVFGAFDAKCGLLKGIRRLFFKQIHMLGINSFCRKCNDFATAVDWAFSHENILYPMITNQVQVSRSNIDVVQIYQEIVKSKLLKGCFIYED